MSDEELERLALIATIAGLIIIPIIMPKYEPINAHYLTKDDQHAYIQGTILKKNYNNETNWTRLEINTCKNTTAFIKENIKKEEGEKIYIQGSYTNKVFNIKTYK